MKKIFNRKVQKASIYSTFTQNGSKNCDLEQIKFLIKSPVLNQQELFSPTGYFGVPSGIKLHKVTASDIKWSAKKRDKRGQTCVEGNLRFLSHNAVALFFLSQLSISKFLFWDISVTNYKTLFFYSICLRFLNPVLNPISAICDENIILDSPIGYWNNDFKGRCK